MNFITNFYILRKAHTTFHVLRLLFVLGLWTYECTTKKNDWREDLAVIAQLQRDDPQQLHADAPCLETWRFWGGMLAHNPHVAKLDGSGGLRYISH